MRISALATMMTLMTVAGLGCGGGTSSSTSDATAPTDAFATKDTRPSTSDVGAPTEPFGLDGKWLFLGPWDGEHTLTFSDQTVKYAGINDEWAASWKLKAYDNQLHHFQMVFDSGNGPYPPTGENFSGTYLVKDANLTVQLAKGLEAYPSIKSSTCVDSDLKPIADCRLYMKQ